jgi:signal transduction histidine kinase
MADSTKEGPEQRGPGSRPIAATLLETLTSRGRLADRSRAARAVGLDENALVDASKWLVPDAIAKMLAAASIEIPVARALGHRLITAEAIGISLFTLGLATPEKAYRRAQALLPREAPEESWAAESIEGEAASLVYRARDVSNDGASAAKSETVRAASCALRRGMLEAVPTLYGLLPAVVHESSCVARGDDACRYRVQWQRTTHRGFAMAAGIGAALGVGIGVGAISLGSGGLATVLGILAGGLVFLGAGAVGRSLDLARQLEAVGGTRRGQLALFEQVDDQLATRLDALARADAKLDETPTAFRVGVSPRRGTEDEADEGETPRCAEHVERDRGVMAAAHAIHVAAGDLECWFDQLADKNSKRSKASGEISDERGRVREIRDWAVRISESISPNQPIRQAVGMGALVARGIASVRPLVPAAAIVDLEVEDGLPSVVCEPVQIEQVVIQLVRNAIEASEALMDVPEANVSVRSVRSGIEIAVEDRGAGIESSAVDEVFDPFFGEAPLGTNGGFGLPLCLRIVEAHGGELRIEAEDRPGTRVSIFLPAQAQANPDTPAPA